MQGTTNQIKLQLLK